MTELSRLARLRILIKLQYYEKFLSASCVFVIRKAFPDYVAIFVESEHTELKTFWSWENVSTRALVSFVRMAKKTCHDIFSSMFDLLIVRMSQFTKTKKEKKKCPINHQLIWLTFLHGQELKAAAPVNYRKRTL